jgi:anthranilate phosphoribosyltransferase
VLSRLGIKIDAPLPIIQACVDELGICFCFAPHFHPAMKHVAAVRKKLGIATIFNLLGPLCNPAGAARQLLGVGRRDLHVTLAEALQKLGTERAMVVHGTDGIGEVSLSAPTETIEVSQGARRSGTWSPNDFGLITASKESLTVRTPEESADLIARVLAGEAGPPRDATVLNAAAALWTAEIETSPHACAERAARSIDSGAARQLLEKWRQLSHRPS